MHGGMHGGMHGEMQGKYYRYCSRSIRYSTDLNSENNKFDMETFDLVSEYCRQTQNVCARGCACVRGGLGGAGYLESPVTTT